MRYQKPVSLAQILSSQTLKPLMSHNKLRTEHETAWQQAIDASLRASCNLSSYFDGTLTVCTDNQTTASQLRYLNKIIMQQLLMHQAYESLKKIRVIVSLTNRVIIAPKVHVQKAIRLNKNTTEHLRNAANSISDHQLSKLLLSLASHGEQTDDQAS